MTRPRTGFLLLAVMLVWTLPSYSQANQGSPTDAPAASDAKPDCFTGTVKDIQKVLASNKREVALAIVGHGMIQRWPVYICYLTNNQDFRSKLMGNAEQLRQDKQPGATSNSPGSTSLVSKGSSPSLLGFALEHGGLTQTTSGSTITFRGNVVNSITALLNSTYLGSYDLSQKDPLVRRLSKLSFGVSFDTSANQPSTTEGFEPSSKNFSGFSAKYEIYNHRDPRDHKWRTEWNKLATNLASKVAEPAGALDTAIKAADHYQDDWESPTSKALAALPESPSDDQIHQVLQDAADRLRQIWSLPAIQAAVETLTSNTLSYVSGEDKLLADIRRTSIATVEYTLARQLTSNDKNVTATQPNQKIPDLSNLNLVLERGFSGVDAPELTLNLGGTWFNSPNTADPKRGRVRDIRASLEADWQLVALTKLNKPTLSLSGQYLNLIAEPLGQQVTLNDVTISRRGPMELFQTKLSVPLGKSSGVKIPLSFTYASRTELVKESDVRGNIGITFDLDSLFSKK